MPPTPMSTSSQQSQQSQQSTSLLRRSGLRVTNPRIAVLNRLHDHPHSDAESIARLVRADLGRVSTQAVYDVLHTFTQAGLVRRIEPAGSPARYEVRVGDNHHHAVCRSCGAVVDVDCAAGRRPCLDVVDDHGFVIDEAEVTYWGICPACQVQQAGEAGAPDPESPALTTESDDHI